MNTNNEIVRRLATKPSNYPICMNTECRNRNTCLHAFETTEQKTQTIVITCINPKMYAEGTECTKYRHSGSTCHYAFGMRTLAERLKSKRQKPSLHERMPQALLPYCILRYIRRHTRDKSGGARLHYGLCQGCRHRYSVPPFRRVCRSPFVVGGCL